jgi:hypothetical protein
MSCPCYYEQDSSNSFSISKKTRGMHRMKSDSARSNSRMANLSSRLDCFRVALCCLRCNVSARSWIAMENVDAALPIRRHATVASNSTFERKNTTIARVDACRNDRHNLDSLLASLLTRDTRSDARNFRLDATTLSRRYG